MESMLSRSEQKTLLSLEVQLPKNPLQKALDQYGYTKHNTELDFNVQDLKAKISPHRPDRCVIGFERVLPRDYRNSIYSVNRNIAESAVVDKEKSLLGIERLSTTRHDARPLQFKYEQEVLVSDLDNSQDLYMKIIKSKESIDYLRKVMEKKGTIKVAKNPIKGTRFA